MPFVPGHGECAPEPCVFPEVTIGADDCEPDGPLRAGMNVVLPCEGCGTPPLSELEWLNGTLEETAAAFDALVVDKVMPLYHWSPAARRKQIVRRGLVPGMRHATHTEGLRQPDGTMWRADYLCFGDDPAWSWALSAGQRGATVGEWDLWQTYSDRLVDPWVLPAADLRNGVHEVRTRSRVYKRDLRLVASRMRDPD